MPDTKLSRSSISQHIQQQGLAHPLSPPLAMCGLPFSALAAAAGLSAADGYFLNQQAVHALGAITACSIRAGVLPLVEMDNSVLDHYGPPAAVYSTLLARVAPSSVCVVSA